MLILCGLLADCEDFEEIQDFGKDRFEYLKTFLELPNGIPSHDTMDRLMRHLKADQLADALAKWGQELVSQLVHKQVCVDGKEIRGTIVEGHKHASVQILSAWVREANASLGELRIEVKSNEIDATPKLLQTIDLLGAVVTADALNCQKKTAETILTGGGDYLLSLKENQAGLFVEVRDQFARRQFALPKAVSLEKEHDRLDRRTVWVDEDLQWLDTSSKWPSLRTVVMVQRERLHVPGSKPTLSFYISSLTGKTADQMGDIIRGHWAVENQLHRHLDVTFSEDACQVRTDNAPQNLSILRKLALQLLKRTPDKVSIKRKRKKAARDNDFLTTVLQQL